MIHEDELIAELTDVVEELCADGKIELATRHGASAVAGPLSLVLEERPDVDLLEWLTDREEIAEVFIDAAELGERLGPTLHRLQHGDGEPKWNDALAEAIYAAPDDLQARLVFGDWLQQEGDPRGELVALQATTGRRRVGARRRSSGAIARASTATCRRMLRMYG